MTAIGVIIAKKRPRVRGLMRTEAIFFIELVFILIKFKLLHPGFIFFYVGLLALVEDLVLKNKNVHLCPHKTSIGILRSTNDRFPSHIE